MKIHSADTRQHQTVTSCSDTSVTISGVVYTSSLIVLPQNPPAAWPVTSFDALIADHLARIAATEPDVVLLGTGLRQRFVRPDLTAPLLARRIGIECMDNRAACRTYNLLMSENRKVVLALIFDPGSNDYQGV